MINPIPAKSKKYICNPETCTTIEELINKTEKNTQKYKKFSERLLKGNDIFTPKIEEFKKNKCSVDINNIKTNKDIAGIRSKPIDEIKYFNEENFKLKF